MDSPDVDPEQLEDSLADLRTVNRWLGGSASVIRRLTPLIRRLHGAGAATIRLLDVGTGSADLPLLLERWCRKRRIPLRVVASDLHAGTVRSAARALSSRPGISLVRSDALRLPFADGSFHLALCSTMLHHLDDAGAVAVLRELDRVASAGILVSDLRRSRGAMAGAHLLAHTLWRRHPITRHDGPASVAAGFTRGELEDLARTAGLRGASVRNEPVFRISLTIDRTRTEAT
jgi:SAM-dependent methyltransferase